MDQGTEGKHGVKKQTFLDVSDAYDFCREYGKPIVLKLPPTSSKGWYLMEIFPSGFSRGMSTNNTRARIIHDVQEHPDGCTADNVKRIAEAQKAGE